MFYETTGRRDLPSKFNFVFADKFKRKLMICLGMFCSGGQGIHDKQDNEFQNVQAGLTEKTFFSVGLTMYL